MVKKVRVLILMSLLSVLLASCSSAEGNKEQNRLSSESTADVLAESSEHSVVPDEEDENQIEAAFDKDLWERNLIFLNYNAWVYEPDYGSGVKEINSFSAGTLKNLLGMSLECPFPWNAENDDSGYLVIDKHAAAQYVREAFNLDISDYIKDEIPGREITDDGECYKIGLSDFGDMVQQCMIEDIKTDGDTIFVSGILRIEALNTDSEYSELNPLFIYDETTGSAVWARSFSAKFTYHPEGAYTKHQLVKIEFQE